MPVTLKSLQESFLLASKHKDVLENERWSKFLSKIDESLSDAADKGATYHCFRYLGFAVTIERLKSLRTAYPDMSISKDYDCWGTNIIFSGWART